LEEKENDKKYFVDENENELRRYSEIEKKRKKEKELSESLKKNEVNYFSFILLFVCLF
jgi:hypothetical protein